MHENVHQQSTSPSQITALTVVSERLGLIGTIDVAEPHRHGYMIIEHKRGSTSRWMNDELQITALAIAFEETTGKQANDGAVFSWKTRRRRTFEITDDHRQLVERIVTDIRLILDGDKRPAPTTEHQRCQGCSLLEHCQPVLTRKLSE